jgi:hypothetical protein
MGRSQTFQRGKIAEMFSELSLDKRLKKFGGQKNLAIFTG